LRRIIIIGTALAALGLAVSAYAATNNTYTAKDSFSPNKAGTAKSPAPIGFTSKLTASGTAGNRAAPLTNITNTFYGLTSNGKYFKTCSLSKIATAENDTSCPKAALVATGGLTAVLGPASNLSATAPNTTPCARNIDVWNAGQGKLVYFFTGPPNTCGGLGTGAVGPFPATLTVKSGTLILDVPIPNSVSFPVPGLQGSLLTEHLSFKNQTIKVKGKTIPFFASVGCKGGKRPNATSFVAGGQKATVTGVPAKCSK
jgi:hypothetical protein